MYVGQTGLYDNVPGKGKPQKKKGGGSGVEEDIYGGLGEGGEGIYDNAGGGRGMKFSEEGVYENPHGTGGFSILTDRGSYEHIYVCQTSIVGTLFT